MASKGFESVLARLKETKKIDTTILNNGYISEGQPVDVVIDNVDTSALEEDRFRITFRSADDRTHTETVFILNQKKDGFGSGIRQLWSACLPDKDAIIKYMTLAGEDQKTALEALTGMKLRITLAHGKGYVIKATGAGQFTANDSKTGDQLIEPQADIETLKMAAEAVGFKRAFLNVKKFEATSKEYNITALNTALEGRAKAPSSAFGKLV